MLPVIPTMKIDNNIDNSIKTKGINTNRKSFQLSRADVILRGNDSNKEAYIINMTSNPPTPDSEETNNSNNNNGDFYLWRRIYANREGYAAIDGGSTGG